MLQKILKFLIISLISNIVELNKKENVTYCSPIGPCPSNKCCQPIAKGLFSNIGTCESLPVDGDPCDINCPCSQGYKCQLNPLCPKCSAVCMQDLVIEKLSIVLNDGCYGKCKEFNHLFNPAPRVRNEAELCNQDNKCVKGSHCAQNIFCKECDHICMHEDLVKPLLVYFQKGCANNCIGQARGIPKILVSKFNPNKVTVDTKGFVVFPEFN